jgi:hypothetical protein
MFDVCVHNISCIDIDVLSLCTSVDRKLVISAKAPIPFWIFDQIDLKSESVLMSFCTVCQSVHCMGAEAEVRSIPEPWLTIVAPPTSRRRYVTALNSTREAPLLYGMTPIFSRNNYRHWRTPSHFIIHKRRKRLHQTIRGLFLSLCSSGIYRGNRKIQHYSILLRFIYPEPQCGGTFEF